MDTRMGKSIGYSINEARTMGVTATCGRMIRPCRMFGKKGTMVTNGTAVKILIIVSSVIVVSVVIVANIVTIMVVTNSSWLFGCVVVYGYICGCR